MDQMSVAFVARQGSPANDAFARSGAQYLHADGGVRIRKSRLEHEFVFLLSVVLGKVASARNEAPQRNDDTSNRCGCHRSRRSRR